VPTPRLRDETPPPSWSRLRRRLRDGPGVLVKINVTARERFRMATASAATTGLVPRVRASDSGRGELDGSRST